jgi:hypothetical protein
MTYSELQWEKHNPERTSIDAGMETDRSDVHFVKAAPSIR